MFVHGRIEHTIIYILLHHTDQNVAYNPSAPPYPLGTQTSSEEFSPATAANSQGSSIYADPSALKYHFEQVLQSLGIPPPVSKPRGKSIGNLLRKSIDRVKDQFTKYFGDLPKECTGENCPQCARIVDAVRIKLPEVSSNKEKYLMLTTLPDFYSIPRLREEFHVTTYMARQVAKLRIESGPFSTLTWKKTGSSLPQTTIDIVQKWYMSDDNSRPSPNARDTILVRQSNGQKTREAKRYMLMNRRDCYEEFKKHHPNLLKFTKFATLRPTVCRWPGHSGILRSCTCQIHENFKLMLEGLKFASIDQLRAEIEDSQSTAAIEAALGDYKKMLSYVLCSPPTDNCYLGFCSVCPNEDKIENVLKYSMGMDIKYNFWEKNDIITKVDSYDDFVCHFKSCLPKFLAHEFIYTKQRDYIHELKNGLMDGGSTVMLTVDFGENYSFVVQNATQGFHWNNRQATIFPFVAHFKKEGIIEYKTYFIISDEMGHDATSFHAFRAQVIEKMKHDLPFMTHIKYVSDGAGSQFKNFKNIGNLSFHQDDYGIPACWIFTATGHGKSTCDALSAVVKRTVRLKSLNDGVIIISAEKMFDVAKQSLTSPTLEFLFVSEAQVSIVRQSMIPRYKRLNRICGIRPNHHFEVQDNKIIQMKRYSASEAFVQLYMLNDEDENDMDIDVPQHKVELGDFVAVRVGRMYQVGMVVNITVDDFSFILRTMQRKGKGGLALVWPESVNEYEVSNHEILTVLAAPMFSPAGKNYKLNAVDVQTINKKLLENN